MKTPIIQRIVVSHETDRAYRNGLLEAYRQAVETWALALSKGKS